MKFLLDTNFLLIPAELKLDVFRLLEESGRPEFFTLNLCLRELKKTSYGELTKEIIRKKGVRIEDTREGSSADFEIGRIAKEKGMVVCTQDRLLINRLRIEKVPVITLRQGRYLIRI